MRTQQGQGHKAAALLYPSHHLTPLTQVSAGYPGQTNLAVTTAIPPQTCLTPSARSPSCSPPQPPHPPACLGYALLMASSLTAPAPPSPSPQPHTAHLPPRPPCAPRKGEGGRQRGSHLGVGCPAGTLRGCVQAEARLVPHGACSGVRWQQGNHRQSPPRLVLGLALQCGAF